jgi:preprotein translocase subunit SecD
MLDFPRWKVWSVSLLCLIGIAFAIPSFFSESTVAKWPSFVPKTQVNLGLDLAGGSHLLLEADTSQVAALRLQQMEDTVRVGVARESTPIQISDLSTSGNRVTFTVPNPAQVDAAVDFARRQTQPVGLGPRDWNVGVIDQNRIVMTPTQAGLANALDTAMKTVREVVYNRIDPEGTREITVVRQGSDRILVQVPGLDDPEGLKQLLGKTARLDFKLVDLTADPAQVAQGRAPVGSQTLPMQGGGAIAVKRRSIVTGDQLIDASQGFDENNQPTVNINFNSTGAKAFARVTRENTGKPFAIILDNLVLSAPNINEPILGGQARISGSFTVESANELAVQLRSGSLPVDLKVIEERSVGPDLGRDSIRSGVIAGIVGTAAVLLFMFVTYGRFGIYANTALVLNVLIILGIMAPFATLTLPGIAGFVLTDRRGGRRQRDHQRAHPRGAEARAADHGRDRARL